LSHGLKTTFMSEKQSSRHSTDILENLWKLELDVVEAAGESMKDYITQRDSGTDMPIFYGTVLQLRNAVSGEYLGFDRAERDHSTGGLIPLSYVEPTRETEFQILPATRARTKGEAIREGDRIALVHNRTRWEVSSRVYPASGQSTSEIVLFSLNLRPIEATSKSGLSFVIEKFSSLPTENLISYYDVITLRHLEFSVIPSFLSESANGNSFALRFSHPRKPLVSEDQTAFSDFADWLMIESLDNRGGPVMWGDNFRLRHPLSGFYLTLTGKALDKTGSSDEVISGSVAIQSAACTIVECDQILNIEEAHAVFYTNRIVNLTHEENIQVDIIENIWENQHASDHIFVTNDIVAHFEVVRELHFNPVHVNYFQTRYRYSIGNSERTFTRTYGSDEQVLFPVPSDYVALGLIQIREAVLQFYCNKAISNEEDLKKFDGFFSERQQDGRISYRFNIAAYLSERVKQDAIEGVFESVTWFEDCVTTLGIKTSASKVIDPLLVVKYQCGQFLFRLSCGDISYIRIPRLVDDADGVATMLLQYYSTSVRAEIALKPTEEITNSNAAIWQFRSSLEFSQQGTIPQAQNVYLYHPKSQTSVTYLNNSTSSAKSTESLQLATKSGLVPEDLWRVLHLRRDSGMMGATSMEVFYDIKMLSRTLAVINEEGSYFREDGIFLALIDRLVDSLHRKLYFVADLPMSTNFYTSLQSMLYGLGFGEYLSLFISTFQPAYLYGKKNARQFRTISQDKRAENKDPNYSKESLMANLRDDKKQGLTKSMLIKCYELLTLLISGNTNTAERCFPYYMIFFDGKSVSSVVMELVFQVLTSAPSLMLNFTPQTLDIYLQIAVDNSDLRCNMFKMLSSPMSVDFAKLRVGARRKTAGAYPFVVQLKWVQRRLLYRFEGMYTALFTDYKDLDNSGGVLVRIGDVKYSVSDLEGPLLEEHLVLLDVIILLVRWKNTEVQRRLRNYFPIQHLLKALDDRTVLSALKSKLVALVAALYVHVEENQPTLVDSVFVWDMLTIEATPTVPLDDTYVLMRWLLRHVIKLIEGSRKVTTDLLQEIYQDLVCVHELLAYGIIDIDQDAPMLRKIFECVMDLKIDTLSDWNHTSEWNLLTQSETHFNAPTFDKRETGLTKELEKGLLRAKERVFEIARSFEIQLMNRRLQSIFRKFAANIGRLGTEVKDMSYESEMTAIAVKDYFPELTASAYKIINDPASTFSIVRSALQRIFGDADVLRKTATNLKSLTLVIDEEDLYGTLRKLRDRYVSLISTARSIVENQEEVLELLDSLCNHLFNMNAAEKRMIVGRSLKPNWSVQEMMRALNFPKYSQIMVYPDVLEKAPKVHKRCAEFIHLLLYRNPKNQSAIAVNWNTMFARAVFVEAYLVRLHSAMIAWSVDDHPEIDASRIDSIIAHILKLNLVARIPYMRYLYVIIANQRTRRKDLQDYVLEAFATSTELLPVDVSLNDDGDLTMTTEEYDYRAAYIELLTATSLRRKDHNLALYRKVLPLEELLESLDIHALGIKMKMQYWSFVRHVYVECDVFALKDSEFALLPQLLEFTACQIKHFIGLCEITIHTIGNELYVENIMMDPLSQDNGFVFEKLHAAKSSIDVSRTAVESIVLSKLIPLVDGVMAMCVEVLYGKEYGSSNRSAHHSDNARNDVISLNSSTSRPSSLSAVNSFSQRQSRGRSFTSYSSTSPSSLKRSGSIFSLDAASDEQHSMAHSVSQSSHSTEDTNPSKRRGTRRHGRKGKESSSDGTASFADNYSIRESAANECKSSFLELLDTILRLTNSGTTPAHMRSFLLVYFESTFYGRRYLGLSDQQQQTLKVAGKTMQLFHTEQLNVFNANFVSSQWIATMKMIVSKSEAIMKEQNACMFSNLSNSLQTRGAHNITGQLSKENIGNEEHVLAVLNFASSVLLRDNALNADFRVQDIAKLKAQQEGMENMQFSDVLLELLQFPSAAVVDKSFELLARMLEGGNETVQRKILSYMSSSENLEGSSPLLLDMERIVMDSTTRAKSEPWWIRTNEKIRFTEVSGAKIILRFIQELCEGHNLQAQNILRGTTAGLHNVIAALITYMDAILPPTIPEALDEIPNWHIPIVHVMEALIESAQGPCKGNQELIAQNMCLDAIYNFLALESNIERTMRDLRKSSSSATAMAVEKASGERILYSLCIQLLLTLTEGSVYFDNMQILARLRFPLLISRKLRAISEVHSALGPSSKQYSDLQGLGIQFYILMKHIASVFAKQDPSNPMRLLTSEQRRTFEPLVGRVEVMVRGELCIVFFQKEPAARFLTSLDRAEVLERVDRSNPSEKVESFILLNEELDTAVCYRASIGRSPMLAAVTHEGSLKVIRRLGNIMAIILNIMLLMKDNRLFWDVTHTLPASAYYNRFFVWVFLVLGVILAVQTLLNSFSYSIAVFPVSTMKKLKRMRVLEMRRGDSNQVQDKIRFWSETVMQLFDIKLVHLLMMTVSAVLGVIGSWSSTEFGQAAPFAAPVAFKYFFAAHLLDIIVQFKLMVTVMQSITKNYGSLLLTVALIALVVYYYAIVAFVFFPEIFYRDSEFDELREDTMCYDLLSCFLTLIGQIPSGSDYLRKVMLSLDHNGGAFYFGTLFQMTFFFLVLIVLLNILFGIIVDTFSQIRSERESILADSKARCFICSIDATSFDRAGTGFEVHQREEHPIWDYTYFHSYVLHKFRRSGTKDFSGPESVTFHALQQFPPNIGFFPIGEATSLQHARSSNVDV
jgi:hypothetical protein